MGNLTWNDKSFRDRLLKSSKGADRITDGALGDVADAVLQQSEKEVPHDVGTLQGTGVVDKPGLMQRIVGYHIKYAARLHEHPEYRFQKGRKGKYLESPIVKNASELKKAFKSVVRNGLRAL